MYFKQNIFKIEFLFMIKSLNIEEQTLLSYIFYKEKTQIEVADIYNISQSSISQKLNNIMRKIRLFILKK